MQNELSDIEEKLIIIWKKILQKDQIDINKSFFVQGGTSVGVVNLCNEIEKEFSGVVKVSDCFKYYSISKLAEFINTKIKDKKLDGESNDKIEISSDKSGDKKINKIVDSLEDGDVSIEEAILKLIDK